MTDVKYEPTREHWTPYEPWMLGVLADDARVSWIDTDTESDPMECRAPWRSLDPVELARLNSLTPVGFMRWFGSLRVHPDDVPERPTEEHPDELDALTPERLYEIRERASLQCGLDGDDADDLLEHVDHLTAENARLRERVTEAVDYCNDPSTWPTTLPGSPA